MKYVTYIVISISCLLFGFLFFVMYHNWIIVRYPSYISEIEQQIYTMKPKKGEVLLHYWKNEKWSREKISVLLTSDKAKNIKYLVNNWLTLLDEEAVMGKKVTLKDVLLDATGQQAYLSFDRILFDDNSATFVKWMLIEGLLKTLQKSGIGLQKVHFLVHHQIMDDYHLDFSKPWPIYGFLSQ